jgi:hypothetical protein
VVEREEPGHVHRVQRLIYYISNALSDYETHYNLVQKLFYAVLIRKHKLLHYFESQPIHVITSYGHGEIIENYIATGRITKWALKLMGLGITYVPQMAIKSQALVDFVAEWTETQQLLPSVIQEHWSMYFNGSFTLSGAG